jgi:hypothetical protein
MRTPSRRERRRQLCDTGDVDLEAIAGRVTYVGSAEHKTYPSAAGRPRRRADATKCDPRLHGDFGRLTEWLRSGIRKGYIAAPWEGDFPRYAWAEIDGTWYEARLVNSVQGTYKGWETTVGQLPEGIST